MEIHPVDIIISLLNIVVLFVLLRMILWKYITRYLSERTARVQKERDDAAALLRDAESLKAEYKQMIADFEQTGQEILEKSRQQAGEEAERIINEARTQAGKIIHDAELRIEIEKAQALKDTQADIAQLATQMAARILEREVGAHDNARTVNDFFDDMKP